MTPGDEQLHEKTTQIPAFYTRIAKTRRWHINGIGRRIIMSEFNPVATVTGLQDGTMKKIRAEGNDLLLARVKQKYYCTDMYCPHPGGDLSQGTLAGTVLTCPLHPSQFDITGGHVMRWTDLSVRVFTVAKTQRPPRPLRTYPVKIEGYNSREKVKHRSGCGLAANHIRVTQFFPQQPSNYLSSQGSCGNLRVVF
jgi:nitrite reductase/ring-hydroxylating ferredoxin subunit